MRRTRRTDTLQTYDQEDAMDDSTKIAPFHADLIWNEDEIAADEERHAEATPLKRRRAKPTTVRAKRKLR